MRTDAIAEVLSEIADGNALPVASDPPLTRLCTDQARRALQTTVDASDIYASVMSQDEIRLYEDHPSAAPPWEEAAIAYENQHGNVLVMPLSAMDLGGRRGDQKWDTPNVVDWERVRWILSVPLYVGGSSGGKRVRTIGPVFLWSVAVYEDGPPADIRWTDLVPRKRDGQPEAYQNAMVVFLGVLNFMGCRNVELVDARQPRQATRRQARMGIHVKELVVRSVGKNYRSGAGGTQASPLTTVVGHFAHYGDCCSGRHAERGLLFGKLEGRYWIPQHARGSADLGEHRNTYKLEISK